LTTVELLEALDSGVSGLCDTVQVLKDELAAAQRDAGIQHNGHGPQAPHDVLRVRMDLSGLTRQEFSTFFGIDPASLDDWLAGSRPIPCWVLPAVQIFELLPAGARRQALTRRTARGMKRDCNSHPFARIEEL
jgi:hypothetical protein